VTRVDVLGAEDIFGPNHGSLKGKTIRQPEEQIPISIMKEYRDVTLCLNIMFVNEMPYLVTISRNIQFGTVESIKSRHNTMLLAALKDVKHLYALRGSDTGMLTMNLSPCASINWELARTLTSIGDVNLGRSVWVALWTPQPPPKKRNNDT
jgi:hypothetical protein